MATFYDELGVEPCATREELVRAYRQRARRLHPDVNRESEANQDMQRLNDAWAVLGDPLARARYDEELRPSAEGPSTEAAVAAARTHPTEAVEVPVPSGWWRLLRPSILIPLVLLVIFVVTAYAAPRSSGPPRPSTSTSTAAPLNMVGSCIVDQPTSVQVVPCSQRPNELVIATVPATAACPAGTTGVLLVGQQDMLCTSPSGR